MSTATEKDLDAQLTGIADQLKKLDALSSEIQELKDFEITLTQTSHKEQLGDARSTTSALVVIVFGLLICLLHFKESSPIIAELFFLAMAGGLGSLCYYSAKWYDLVQQRYRLKRQIR